MADIREREPNTQAEEELIVIQRSFDLLGKIAWQAVCSGKEIEPEITNKQKTLKESATEVLNEIITATEPTDFVARYFYENNEKQVTGKKIQYPLDYMFFVATIKGSLQDVNSYPVAHPSLNRSGDIGFRLCARIEATRAMGWIGSKVNTEDFFVPIGELYLNGHNEPNLFRMEDEAFQPIA